MRPWAALVGLAGIAACFAGSSPKPKVWTVVVGGDVAGYLSPCGCTYPMSGGIKRWATVARLSGDPKTTLIVENGGLVSGAGKQDLLKAEALANALGTIGVAAINLTSSEAPLGVGEIGQVDQLAGGVLVSTAVSGVPNLDLAEFRRKGPFIIGGAIARPDKLSSLGGQRIDAVTAARRLVSRAKAERLVPILLYEGDEAEASDVARQTPGLRLIVYSRGGNPPGRPTTVGDAVLVTPGERGKFLVRLSYSEGKFLGYTPTSLWPSVKDDPTVSQIYKAYLSQVDRANLLSSWPRKATQGYVGSEKCGSCHAQDYHIWSISKHAGALKSLEAQGHSKDPDCVSCHVTGLDSLEGYRSRALTPTLATVGCESCHGPGREHSDHPNVVKLAKVGDNSCKPCHTVENSPTFDFLTYWRKVRHGK